jgi:hypothetical protein
LITDNLKTFRHLNIDHLIVGWYQSSLFGKFVNKSFIEDNYSYQQEIQHSIVIVYGKFFVFVFYFLIFITALNQKFLNFYLLFVY